MRRPALLMLLVLGALLGAMAAMPALVQAPELRGAAAPGSFDTARAVERLARILGDQRPHPADSPASDGVRARLVAEIRAMGMEPVVRDSFTCNGLSKSRGVSCARVRNVRVTIGPTEGRHLLLNTHYDSSAAGPGAVDAGAGVASLLEVASIVKDEPLRRPVTFLFNEGEEVGLIGARAFLDRDPLAAQVDSLLNFEARGTTGPVSMFETSQPNEAPVRLFAEAVQRPVANSLATDAYRQLPNATDVNSFAERSWLTLNFAMIGNETRYHSAGDDLAALDPRSVQHMGDQALSMARRLAAGTPEGAGELIYMDVLGRFLVRLPRVVGMVLLGGLVLLLSWLSVRRRRLGRGTAAVLAALVLATALAWAGMALLGTVRAGMFWRAYPVWTHLAVYATAIVAALAVLSTIARRLDRGQLRAVFWFAFVLIGAAVAVVAPGGIIYFLFPPLLFVAGALLARRRPWAETAASLAAAAALYLTLGAMLGLLQEMLNSGPLWLFAPLGLLVLMPFLIEAKPLVEKAQRPVLISVAVAFAGWAVAAAVPAYSQDRQQRFTIEHVRDLGTGASFWAIDNDGAPLPAALGDGWSREELPHSMRRRWIKPAGVAAPVSPPALQVVAARADGEVRRLRFRLQSNGAQSISLVMPEDSNVLAAGTPSSMRRIGEAGTDGDYAVRCTGRSCDGMILELLVGKDEPVTAKLIGTHHGLPPEAAALIAARPALARPQYSADSSVAVRHVRF